VAIGFVARYVACVTKLVIQDSFADLAGVGGSAAMHEALLTTVKGFEEPARA